ncbi:uncharacterized protein [Haliotis cracherodii]|uniref:uncharacterized protein n=1 Tax=Haliotis cracherodii TaxID=6455 RepID=UPI0039EA016D
MVSLSTQSVGMDGLLRILLLSFNVWLSVAFHCTFPPEWRGTWYQSGVAQGKLQITKHSISQRGHCVNSVGNKYLLLDKSKSCFVCLVFTPQHDNLLQFKESYCTRDDKLPNVCGRITGDDILHTIVKVPSVPVACPFQGPYSFSYNNQTNRDCDSPSSEIQECADSSKFIFKYKRCQHTPETRDQDMQFQCLATWFNGDFFLYGMFTGSGLTEHTQMYRCFMYSFYGSQGQMAMSADPTCQGIQSPRTGYLTMSLSRAVKWTPPSCSFNEFLSVSREWRDIAGKFRFVLDEDIEQFRIFNVGGRRGDRSALMSVRCMGIVEEIPDISDNTATWPSQTYSKDFITYTTNDSCVSKYQCLRLRKRGPAVVELMLGTPVNDQERACNEWSFDNVHKYVILPMESRVVPCPLPGSYSYVDKMSDCRGEIEIGCSEPTIMAIKASCPSGHHTVELFQCNQNWTEHPTGAQYIITSKPGDTIQKVSDCLVYKESIDGFELVAEEECGGGNLRMMKKPIGVIIQPSRQACKTPDRRVQPQPSTNPHTRAEGEGHTHDVRGGRDNRGYSDNNHNTIPQLDKKDITIINTGTRRTCSLCVTLLCVLVTLLSSLR